MKSIELDLEFVQRKLFWSFRKKKLLISLLNCHVNGHLTTILKVLLSSQNLHLMSRLIDLSRNDQIDLRIQTHGPLLLIFNVRDQDEELCQSHRPF